MINWLLDLFQDRNFGATRSPEWREVRAEHIALHPRCATCGAKSSFIKPNEAHHILPFHLNPALELDETNLITLCRRCHLLIGHLGSFMSYNKTVVKDSEYLREKIMNRP